MSEREHRVVSARWLWIVTITFTFIVLAVALLSLFFIATSDDPQGAADYISNGFAVFNVIIVSVLAMLTKSAYEATKKEDAAEASDPFDILARLEKLEDVVYRNGHLPTEEDDG